MPERETDLDPAEDELVDLDADDVSTDIKGGEGAEPEGPPEIQS